MSILNRFVQSFLLLMATFVAYLLAVGLVPGMAEPKQELKPRKAKQRLDPGQPASRESVRFDVDGIPVHAWFYLPGVPGTAVACIVMAHGLGGTKEMELDLYARRFQAAGFAVLVFDYRYWGESGGAPRHLIWIPHQLADWRAAVGYARSRPEVDANRIALWGTSLSGGHVVAIAAQDPGIAAVAAQCPGLDGHVALEESFRRTGVQGSHLRLIVHAQRDLVRSWLGLPAHKVPVVGPPGSVALLTSTQAMQAFEELAPADYVNEACARIAIRGDKYRPIKQAHRIQCPVLLQICEFDAVTPPVLVAEASRRLGKHAQVVRYPIDHFDIYKGEHLQQAVDEQIRFYQRCLIHRAVMPEP
jgi:uncharacterized protein